MIDFTINIPDDPLKLSKSILDVLTFLAFVGLLLVLIISRNKFPLLNTSKVTVPIGGGTLLGIISTFMDAVDEFVWFSPQAFYNDIWKPTRLGLLLIATLLFILGLYNFYNFTHRLFGNELPE